MKSRLVPVAAMLTLLGIPLAAQDLAHSFATICRPFVDYFDGREVDHEGLLSNYLPMRPPSDSKKFPNYTVRQEYQTKIRNFTVALYDRTLADGLWDDLLMLVSWNPEASDLALQRELFDLMKSLFGEPFKVVDYGFSPRAPSKGFSYASVQTEWKRGKRKLLFTSENIIMSTGTPMPLYATLQASEATEDLVDLAYLRLTMRTFVGTNGNESAYTADPFVIMVDLNGKRVMGPNWTYLGTILDLSPANVTASWGAKDSGSSLSLDRYAGTFTLEVIDSRFQDGKQKVKGTYERTEPQQAKLF